MNVECQYNRQTSHSNKGRYTSVAVKAAFPPNATHTSKYATNAGWLSKV